MHIFVGPLSQDAVSLADGWPNLWAALHFRIEDLASAIKARIFRLWSDAVCPFVHTG
jgi:hypothetical protein